MAAATTVVVDDDLCPSMLEESRTPAADDGACAHGDFVGPVTAVHFVGADGLLAGIGPAVHAYPQLGHGAPRGSVRSSHVLASAWVHGITSTRPDASSGGLTRRDHLVLVHGGRECALLALDESSFALRPLWRATFAAWVLSAAIAPAVMPAPGETPLRINFITNRSEVWRCDLVRGCAVRMQHSAIEGGFRAAAFCIAQRPAAAPDAEVVLTSGTVDGTLLFWTPRAAGAAHVLQAYAGAHDGAIFACAWHAAGDRLATVGDDRRLVAWAWEEPERTVRPLDAWFAHEARPWAVAFVDEHTLVTASEDCTAKVWRVGTRAPVRVIRGMQHGKGLWCVAVRLAVSAELLAASATPAALCVLGGSDSSVQLCALNVLQHGTESAGADSKPTAALDGSERRRREHTHGVAAHARLALPPGLPPRPPWLSARGPSAEAAQPTPEESKLLVKAISILPGSECALLITSEGCVYAINLVTPATDGGEHAEPRASGRMPADAHTRALRLFVAPSQRTLSSLSAAWDGLASGRHVAFGVGAVDGFVHVLAVDASALAGELRRADGAERSSSVLELLAWQAHGARISQCSWCDRQGIGSSGSRDTLATASHDGGGADAAVHLWALPPLSHAVLAGPEKCPGEPPALLCTVQCTGSEWPACTLPLMRGDAVAWGAARGGVVGVRLRNPNDGTWRTVVARRAHGKAGVSALVAKMHADPASSSSDDGTDTFFSAGGNGRVLEFRVHGNHIAGGVLRPLRTFTCATSHIESLLCTEAGLYAITTDEHKDVLLWELRSSELLMRASVGSLRRGHAVCLTRAGALVLCTANRALVHCIEGPKLCAAGTRPGAGDASGHISVAPTARLLRARHHAHKLYGVSVLGSCHPAGSTEAALVFASVSEDASVLLTQHQPARGEADGGVAHDRMLPASDPLRGHFCPVRALASSQMVPMGDSGFSVNLEHDSRIVLVSAGGRESLRAWLVTGAPVAAATDAAAAECDSPEPGLRAIEVARDDASSRTVRGANAPESKLLSVGILRLHASFAPMPTAGPEAFLVATGSSTGIIQTISLWPLEGRMQRIAALQPRGGPVLCIAMVQATFSGHGAIGNIDTTGAHIVGTALLLAGTTDGLLRAFDVTSCARSAAGATSARSPCIVPVLAVRLHAMGTNCVHVRPACSSVTSDGAQYFHVATGGDDQAVGLSTLSMRTAEVGGPASGGVTAACAPSASADGGDSEPQPPHCVVGLRGATRVTCAHGASVRGVHVLSHSGDVLTVGPDQLLIVWRVNWDMLQPVIGTEPGPLHVVEWDARVSISRSPARARACFPTAVQHASALDACVLESDANAPCVRAIVAGEGVEVINLPDSVVNAFSLD